MEDSASESRPVDVGFEADAIFATTGAGGNESSSSRGMRIGGAAAA